MQRGSSARAQRRGLWDCGSYLRPHAFEGRKGGSRQSSFSGQSADESHEEEPGESRRALARNDRTPGRRGQQVKGFQSQVKWCGHLGSRQPYLKSMPCPQAHPCGHTHPNHTQTHSIQRAGRGLVGSIASGTAQGVSPLPCH